MGADDRSVNARSAYRRRKSHREHETTKAVTALRQMLVWGEKRKPWQALLIEGNPTELIEIPKIVEKDYDLANIRDRVLSLDEIRELQAILGRMKREYSAAEDKRRAIRPIALKTQLAIWVCLSTLSRIGETLNARWEHVDLAAGTWYIPKENVKKTKAGQRALTVFLSPFAKTDATASELLFKKFGAPNAPAAARASVAALPNIFIRRLIEHDAETMPVNNHRQTG